MMVVNPPACGLDVQDVDLQQVPRLRPVYVDRAGKGMDQRQVDVEQVGGLGRRVDLHIESVARLHHDFFARVCGDYGGNVRVPAVVTLAGFAAALLGVVQLNGLHSTPPHVAGIQTPIINNWNDPSPSGVISVRRRGEPIIDVLG